MTFAFSPAVSFKERVGLFVSLTGGTNSGKTFSALRLARGIAGPAGKIAVLDTEGGRTLHLKEAFAFDANIMEPPFTPDRFAQAALAAETARYDALVIDSFSMEWVGLGGVLDWQAIEHQKMGGADRTKGASWIKPKMAHKAMVYSLLQRRIPIIFSIRGEETFIPPNTKVFKSITNKQFPFEMTVAFRLESDRKGYIDLSDPKSWKMEGAHREILRDGDLINENHGAALAAWARGEHQQQAAPPQPAAPRRGKDALFVDARAKAEEGSFAFNAWKAELPARARQALDEIQPELDEIATAADARDAGDYGLDDPDESFPGDRSEAA